MFKDWKWYDYIGGPIGAGITGAAKGDGFWKHAGRGAVIPAVVTGAAFGGAGLAGLGAAGAGAGAAGAAAGTGATGAGAAGATVAGASKAAGLASFLSKAKPFAKMLPGAINSMRGGQQQELPPMFPSAPQALPISPLSQGQMRPMAPQVASYPYGYPQGGYYNG